MAVATVKLVFWRPRNQIVDICFYLQHCYPCLKCIPAAFILKQFCGTPDHFANTCQQLQLRQSGQFFLQEQRVATGKQGKIDRKRGILHGSAIKRCVNIKSLLITYGYKRNVSDCIRCSPFLFLVAYCGGQSQLHLFYCTVAVRCVQIFTIFFNFVDFLAQKHTTDERQASLSSWSGYAQPVAAVSFVNTKQF